MGTNTNRDLSRLLIDAVQHPEKYASATLPEWDILLRLAKRANLLGRIAESISTLDLLPAVPTPVRAHLESANVLAIHQRQAIAWEVRHIGRALTSFGAPVVLLKGAAYAVTDLIASRGRLFGDVDVLVPKVFINQAEAALMLNGWSSGGADPYDERYYRQWMHELPPMAHCKRGTIIDVHHNILPLTARYVPVAELLLQAAVKVPGSDFHVLSPCDMVIHSATHLFHEGELNNGLRDLFDLHDLLVEFSVRHPNFWLELPQRAKTLGLSWPLHLAIRYTNKILGTPVPNSVRELVAKDAQIGALSQSLLDAVYERALNPVHPLCSNVSVELARWCIYVRSHYLRMPVDKLIRHLGRKAFMRTFKSTSRAV